MFLKWFCRIRPCFLIQPPHTKCDWKKLFFSSSRLRYLLTFKSTQSILYFFIFSFSTFSLFDLLALWEDGMRIMATPKQTWRFARSSSSSARPMTFQRKGKSEKGTIWKSFIKTNANHKIYFKKQNPFKVNLVNIIRIDSRILNWIALLLLICDEGCVKIYKNWTVSKTQKTPFAIFFLLWQNNYNSELEQKTKCVKQLKRATFFVSKLKTNNKLIFIFIRKDNCWELIHGRAPSCLDATEHLHLTKVYVQEQN